jgi:gliding motility-associated protein GldE
LEVEPDRLLSLLPFLLAANAWIPALLSFLAITLLLMCSALVSGSEIAFFSLSHNDLSELKQEGGAKNERILRLKERPKLLLATILISNNFINILIVLLSEYALRHFLPPGALIPLADWIAETLAQIGLSVSASGTQKVFRWIITVLLVTFLLVLFGEVAPKRYAKLNNLRLAHLMSRPLSLLIQLFSPLSLLLITSTDWIENRLVRLSSSGNLGSKEDIDEAIELTVKNDDDSDQEVDILKRIVKFGEVSVKQIMRSRVDVTALDVNSNFKELLDTVQASGYSRIPVYEEDFDKVIGILYVKDLLGHLDEDEDFKWQDLIRDDVLYTPEAKKIDDLMREFQQKHLHMAIVVDEYGGSAGIVTLEDILEEVIGDIHDEFEPIAESKFRKLDDRNFLFEGKTLLNDVARVLEKDPTMFDPWRGDSDSLAGLILELRGRIPKKGAEITVDGIMLKVMAVDDRRIREVKLTLIDS